LLFLFGNVPMMAAETDPEEIMRGWVLAAAMTGASVVAGAVLVFRRSGRQSAPVRKNQTKFEPYYVASRDI
jgi:hypothetical protein